jgi:hypothetical protein
MDALPRILAMLVLMSGGLAACAAPPPAPPSLPPPMPVKHSVELVIPPPQLLNGSKLALVHEFEGNESEAAVGALLQDSLFRLRRYYPSLTIVERSQVRDLQKELSFQHSGRVRDEEVVRVGRLMGVDYVGIYHLDAVESVFSRFDSRAYIENWPVLVLFKIVRIESGEVVFSCVGKVSTSIRRIVSEGEIKAINRESFINAAKQVQNCLLEAAEKGSPNHPR